MTLNLCKAAFLDRDGVINIDHAYVHKIEDFNWLPGVLEAAHALHTAGYALVVVTNQSGIGRGYYDKAAFERLTDWMKARFAEAGAPLAGVYFCPHHPDEALEVFDVSGAGDTAIATLALMLTEGKDWQTAVQIANRAAGIVVSRFGTTAVTAKDLGL